MRERVAPPRGPTIVVLFNRDLRIHDHPALAAAAANAETVVPLFVLDPALLAGSHASPNPRLAPRRRAARPAHRRHGGVQNGVPAAQPVSRAGVIATAVATTTRVVGSSNRILGALPAGERDRLIGTMKMVELPIKTVLFEPGAPIDAVYFPISGVISLVTALDDGNIVEVATVGNEGIVGVPHVAHGSLAVRAISQVAGSSLRMEGTAFLAEWEPPGPLRDLVQNYLQALFGQVSQAAACNRLHSNEERLSRWLLMSHDRVGVDEFLITHEFLLASLAANACRRAIARHERAELLLLAIGVEENLADEGVRSSRCQQARPDRPAGCGVARANWQRLPARPDHALPVAPRGNPGTRGGWQASRKARRRKEYPFPSPSVASRQARVFGFG